MKIDRHAIRRAVATRHCLKLLKLVVAWTWVLDSDHARNSRAAKMMRLTITATNSIEVQAMPYRKRGATCFKGLAISGFVGCPGESPIKQLLANNTDMFMRIPQFWQEEAKETYPQAFHTDICRHSRRPPTGGERNR